MKQNSKIKEMDSMRHLILDQFIKNIETLTSNITFLKNQFNQIEKSTKCYEVMGLKHDASDKEIKTRYKQLSLKMHPDKNPNNAKNAGEIFRIIGNAYNQITENRKAYDNFLNSEKGKKQNQETDNALSK